LIILKNNFLDKNYFIKKIDTFLIRFISILYYNMADNTMINLFGRSITGTSILVPVIFKKVIVDDIKTYISEKLNIEKNNLKIILCGVELKDNVYLRDTDILHYACFHFIVKQAK